MDASFSKLLDKVTSQIPKACTTKEDHRSLTPEVKESWSNIPNAMKGIILQGRSGSRNDRVTKNNKDSCKHVTPPSFKPKKFNKANLHELLVELISETSLSDTNKVNNSE